MCKKVFNLMKIILCIGLLFLSINVNAQSIKIISYNANLLPNIPISPLTKNLNHPFKRAKLIPYELDKYKPDVVVFEEDIGPISAAILNKHMKKLGFKYYTKIVGSWDLSHINLLNGGVIVYSRYPFAEDPQYLVYPKSYGWESISNKGAIFAAIKKDGFTYNIIATHLQSIDQNSKDTESQLIHWQKQIGALAQFIANLNLSASKPLIIVGDLNADSQMAIPGEIPKKEITPIYNKLLSSLNAKEVAPYANNTLPFSFDGKTNLMINDVNNRQTLDHFLCISGYLCANQDKSSIQIIAVKSDKLEKVNDLSDHYAILADLSYFP